jgi:hypothetical protein
MNEYESEGHEPGDCEECPESIWPMCPEHMAIQIDELRVQLAKVTAERDQARHSAEVYRDAWAEVLDDDDPSDKNYLAWERATPTEGE